MPPPIAMNYCRAGSPNPANFPSRLLASILFAAVNPLVPRDVAALNNRGVVLQELGRYEEAWERLNEATRLVPLSFRLRLLAREAARCSGHEDEARRHLQGMRALITSRVPPARDPDSVAALGETALQLGVEPRLVLENFFKPARQATPPGRDGFLAAGRLADGSG